MMMMMMMLCLFCVSFGIDGSGGKGNAMAMSSKRVALPCNILHKTIVCGYFVINDVLDTTDVWRVGNMLRIEPRRSRGEVK